MNNEVEQLNKLVEPQCFGRNKYFTSIKAEEINKENIVDFVNKYFKLFISEIGSIIELKSYFRGKQPILSKEREIPENENTKMVVNLARTACKNIKAAFIGEETQYMTNLSSDEVQNKALKDLMSLYRVIEEGAQNSRIEGDRGIYGYAYEYVKRERNGSIKFKRLQPYRTFTVHSEEDEDETVFACNFFIRHDIDGNELGFKMKVYTPIACYEYNLDKSFGLDGSIIEFPNPLCLIPIVEYPNNDELMGDFEPAIPILNAINTVYSNRIDNIVDIVEAILVFINTEIYEEKIDNEGKTYYDSSKLKTMNKNRVIEIKGETGLPADIKHVVNTLDQANAQIVCDNLARLAYVVMGVPDGVNAKTSGGGDTGEAANTREGYKSFEQLLNDKERLFKKSLKQRIELVKRLSLFDNDNQIKFLKVEELDIRFIRSKSLNSQSDAQVISALEASGLFSPETIIANSNLCESPKEEIDKVIANYKELKNKGILTEEQYKLAVASYYLPSNLISAIFTTGKKEETPSVDKEKNDGK